MKYKKLTCQLFTLGFAGLGLNLKLWSGVPQLKKKKQKKNSYNFSRERIKEWRHVLYILSLLFYTQLLNDDFLMYSTCIYENQVVLADDYKYYDKKTWTLKSGWTVSLEMQNLGIQEKMRVNNY